MIWLLICLVTKKLNPIVTELFIRGRKLNISIIFITQYGFFVPENIGLNSMHYFIMEIPNKQKHQQVTFNCLSDIEIQDFMNLYYKKIYCKTIFFFSHWCYFCIRLFFTFYKESFRKNVRTTHDNWW